MLPCLVYLAAIGLISFGLGRILPKSWFCPHAFPYRPFSFEDNGAIYHKLGIRRWQDRIPDMSRLLPGLMPRKAIPGRPTARQLDTMLRETCVAEWTHAMLSLAGLSCLYLWPGVGGVIVTVIYILGNLPFILVQRYNRPRLMRLYARLTAGTPKEAAS